MRKNPCRVIKIDKEALFEFIYENFITQEEDMLDISDSVDVSNNFAIDWERGEFIFAAYKDEDEAATRPADTNQVSAGLFCHTFRPTDSPCDSS